jgi:hypothetical protein
VSYECFSSNVLQRAEKDASVVSNDFFDPTYPERFCKPRGGRPPCIMCVHPTHSFTARPFLFDPKDVPAVAGTYSARYKIPEALNCTDHCVLQVTTSGDSWPASSFSHTVSLPASCSLVPRLPIVVLHPSSNLHSARLLVARTSRLVQRGDRLAPLRPGRRPLP